MQYFFINFATCKKCISFNLDFSFMKKLFLFFVVLILSVSFVNAVPAYPGLITTTQPDGTVISFYLRGDENFSFKMSEDGFLLTQNENGIFEYADFRDNNIVSLGVKASDVRMRTSAELIFLERAVKVSDIQMQLTETINLRKQQRSAKEVQRAIKYPTQGAPKSLVILVNFKDIKFIKETANVDFTNMLNQDGYSENGATSSAREYFRTSSFGQFDPNFVVVGPYDLPRDCAFYGENSSRGGYDLRADSMIIHACMLADEAGLDFTEFDTDGDGRLDNVFVYYAGHNEAEFAGDNTVWPHRSSVYSKTLFDGIKLGSYACTSELKGRDGEEQCGIGTFCHEFGHVIELPDFYVTDYSHDLPTLYQWDIMDRGSYNNEGRTPPVYSAYERFFLGWLKPEPLDSLGVYGLEPLITSNKAYILSKTKHNMDGYNPDPVEFFILENRQKIGIDSLALSGEGLLITHINYNKSLWMTGRNNPNKDPNDMCVQIECAAGTTYEPKRNPFPGADNIFDFDFVFKDNQVWDNSLSAINNKDRNISFVYGDPNDTHYIAFNESLSDFCTVANKKQFKDLDVLVRNVEGDVKFSFLNSSFYLLAQRLEDGTITTPQEELVVNIPSKDEHLLNIVAVFYPRGKSTTNNYFTAKLVAESDYYITSLDVRGKSRRVLEVPTPIAFEAKNVKEGSFIANWSYDDKATSYYLSVYKKTNKPSGEIEEFETFAEGTNPKGWWYNFLTVDSVNYASSPLSLNFVTNSDTLWTKDYILPVSSFEFWINSLNGSKGNIMVDAFVDSVWVNVSVQAFNEESVEEIIKVKVDDICYKFRIYVDFENGEGGLLFDDFKALSDYTAEYIYQDEEIIKEEGEENKKVVRDYSLKQNYYYRVRATDKQNKDLEGLYENITDYSNEVCVGDNGSIHHTSVEPLNITFIDGHFVVNLKELHENYVIYIYSADGSLVEEIEPTSKKVVLPRLDANMYVVKYSEKGKVSRKDQVGKIFY